jgi:nucleotide-binding universal stress UspA family protein
MSESQPHVLLCYDGSPEAALAIEAAGRLLAGGRATVLYAWRSTSEALARFGTPAVHATPEDFERDQEHARGVAREGAELARNAGFEAEARTAHSAAPTWAAILYASEELEVDLVVLWARGPTGFRSLLLGSVSHHVVNLTRRPALVFPSPQLVEDRSRAGLPEVPVQLDPSPR